MFHITNLPSIIPSNPIEWLPPTSKAPILPTSSSLIFWIAHKILLSSILPKRDDYQIPISLYAPKKNGLWPPLLVSFLSCIPRISTEEIFPATYDLSHLNSTNSLVITNISGQSFQIFNAFNFLGDHLSNILCLDAMRSILIFNERNGFPPEINAGALTGLNGLYFALNLFPLQPLVPLDGNGDFNGDGFGDILLRNSAATKLFIFFGRSRGSYPAQVNSALATTISYIFPNSATFAGDINHDGFDDLMFSFYYPLKTPTCNGTNAFYILYGNSNTTNKTILFNPKLIPTLKGAVVTAQGGGCSRNIGLFYGANVGDVNGDGIPDVAFGAPYNLQSAGSVYVLFGNTNLSSEIDLDNLPQNQGFRVDGVKDSGAFFGTEVKKAGDLNGDGKGDFLIIGKPLAPPLPKGYNGAISLIFGTVAPNNLKLSELDGITGFTLNILQNSPSPYEITARAAGDINQDSIDDLVVSHQGIGYALFGRRAPFPPVFNLTSLNGVFGFIIQNTRENAPIRSINAGDLNGDGVSDIWVNSNSSMQQALGKITVIFPQRFIVPPSSNGSDPKTWMWILVGLSGAIVVSAIACVAYRYFLVPRKKRLPNILNATPFIRE